MRRKVPLPTSKAEIITSVISFFLLFFCVLSVEADLEIALMVGVSVTLFIVNPIVMIIEMIVFDYQSKTPKNKELKASYNLIKLNRIKQTTKQAAFDFLGMCCSVRDNDEKKILTENSVRIIAFYKITNINHNKMDSDFNKFIRSCCKTYEGAIFLLAFLRNGGIEIPLKYLAKMYGYVLSELYQRGFEPANDLDGLELLKMFHLDELILTHPELFKVKV